jgi:Flp pilus assembly protein TadG
MRPASVTRLGRRGTTAVEFAIVAPVLLMLSLGTTDIVVLMRAQMRVDSAAQQLGQVVSQCNRIVAPGDIDQFWNFAQTIVGTQGVVTGPGAAGAVIVSAVGQVSGANRVVWQYRTGSADYPSRIGTSGATATLPGGATIPTGQTMFVTEVYLGRQQWSMAEALMGANEQRTLAGISLFLTRATDAPSLQVPPAASATPVCTA